MNLGSPDCGHFNQVIRLCFHRRDFESFVGLDCADHLPHKLILPRVVQTSQPEPSRKLLHSDLQNERNILHTHIN